MAGILPSGKICWDQEGKTCVCPEGLPCSSEPPDSSDTECVHLAKQALKAENTPDLGQAHFTPVALLGLTTPDLEEIAAHQSPLITLHPSRSPSLQARPMLC